MGGEKTNKKSLVVMVVLLVITLWAPTISIVLATKPMPVSGSWTITPNPIFEQTQAGQSDNVFRASVDTVTLIGDIEGTGTYDRCLTLHDFGPGFWVTQKGVIAIEATVDGNSGTLYIRTSANSQKSPDGHWSIIGGTGDLSSLHGQGTFSHVTPLLFTYEGQVHFDP